jgi:hypothetical protein
MNVSAVEPDLDTGGKNDQQKSMISTCIEGCRLPLLLGHPLRRPREKKIAIFYQKR